MKSAENVNLVYIASSGRSGSTLLELLLGSHSCAFGVGEIQELPWFLDFQRRRQRPCGCGLDVLECPFWKEVIDKTKLDEQKQPLLNCFMEKTPGITKILRWGLIKTLVLNNWRDPRMTGEIQQYGLNNYIVFRDCLLAATKLLDKRPDWIVDSSKILWRLIWLQLYGNFNVKVIHLIKDPRAFVFSTTKRVIKPQGYSVYSRQYANRAIRMSARWLVENYLIDLACRKLFDPSQVIKVRYEDLAGTPEKTLLKICSFLGWSYTSKMIENFRINESHSIAGNPMRNESVGIYLDEKWRNRLPKFYALLSRGIAYPFLKRFGY